MKCHVVFPVLAMLSLCPLMFGNSVYGLECQQNTMSGHFENADAVFLGKAMSKSYHPNPVHEDRFDAVTLFSVIESFKGIHQDTINVTSSEWSWGYNFTNNLEYVVFAYDNGQHLRYQLCAPTSPLEHADIEEIRLVANDLESAEPDSIHLKSHVGKIQWLEASYLSSGTAVARVIDPDMDLNPEKIDNFDVFVWSDSHTKGVTQTATETGVSTGVFESTVFLSLTFDACCNRLKVTDGDTLTAEYEDSTLPASYTADALSIIAKSEIRPLLESPLKQFKSGIGIEQISCKEGLEIAIKKSNWQPLCLTHDTREKLIQRGWAEPADIVEGEWIDRSK